MPHPSLAGLRAGSLVGVLAAAVLAGALGVGSVLAFGGPASVAAPALELAASPVPTTSNGAAANPALRARLPRLRRLLRRSDSVELEARTRDGWQTVVGQRGTIVSLTAHELVLALPSGKQSTWSLDDSTKVRAQGQAADASDLRAGERVLVLGVVQGGHDVARHIRTLPVTGSAPGPSGPAGPSSSPTPGA